MRSTAEGVQVLRLCLPQLKRPLLNSLFQLIIQSLKLLFDPFACGDIFSKNYYSPTSRSIVPGTDLLYSLVCIPI